MFPLQIIVESWRLNSMSDYDIFSLITFRTTIVVTFSCWSRFERWTAIRPTKLEALCLREGRWGAKHSPPQRKKEIKQNWHESMHTWNGSLYTVHALSTSLKPILILKGIAIYNLNSCLLIRAATQQKTLKSNNDSSNTVLIKRNMQRITVCEFPVPSKHHLKTYWNFS